MTQLYTISEIADKLQLSTKTLRRWEETGKFKSSRTLGGQRRYTVTDLQILDAIKHGTIPDSSDLLTVEQAAELFGVTPTTIARWEEAGKIHPLITAGVTYYPRHRLLANREQLRSLIPYQEPVFQPVAIPQPQRLPVYRSPNPAPKLPQQLELQKPLSPNLFTIVGLNIGITLLMLFLYHIITVRSSTPLIQPTNQGSVQGVSDDHSATLSILDSILDSGGNLRAQSVTTPKLSLSPGSPPTKVGPGSIYFDAGTQTIKVYLAGTWKELAFVSSATPATSSALPLASPKTTLTNPIVR